MDHARSLRGLVALVDGPGPAFVGSGREEGLQVEQCVGRLDEPHHARLFEPDLAQEHRALLGILQLGDLRLDLGRDDQDLRVLPFHGAAHRLHIGVTGRRGTFVHVAHVQHGLVGQQAELAGDLAVLRIVKLHFAGVAALFEDLLVAEQHVHGLFRLFVAARLGLLLQLGKAVGHRFEVFDLQFNVDDLLVPDRIDRAVHVGHVRVVEAAQHVEDGVGFTDVGKELVSKTFSPARTFDQARDVHDLDRGGDGPFRVADVCQDAQASIRHRSGADVRFDGAEGKVRRLRLRGADAVEEGRFADVGQSHDSAFQSHFSLLNFITRKDTKM